MLEITDEDMNSPNFLPYSYDFYPDESFQNNVFEVDSPIKPATKNILSHEGKDYLLFEKSTREKLGSSTELADINGS